ncbi:MAG TPA: maleylpyruvate isomerase family mycothiol-dependent enzyme [Pseudonocardiaceae bacterium]|jgi:uncharacterized protein (TIGR03083 family)|nr:maleylpyruvate isomerase family mycothiol-dependent enzyme [Pseudonocardiaceae bacterium]
MTALVEYGRLLQRFAIEAELLAETIDHNRLDDEVPGCPGLTVREAARHVGSDSRMILRWLREGYRPRDWQREPAANQSLADYVRTGTTPLMRELAEHQPEDPCPGWYPPEQNYGFWLRRMTHEVTVHRVDLQAAYRRGLESGEVPEDIAIDGIDEILHVWFEYRLTALRVSGTKARSCTVRSGDRNWLTVTGPGDIGNHVYRLWSTPDRTAWRQGEENSGEVHADPNVMYLWLWGRRGVSQARSNGDDDAFGQLWVLLRLATR